MDIGEISQALNVLLAGLCGQVDLGRVKGFIDLQKHASNLGFRICTCWKCANPEGPLQEKKNFTHEVTTKDGLARNCRTCATTPGLIKKAKEERKTQASQEIDDHKVNTHPYNVETDVMRDILVPGLQQAFKCVVMPEFRRADLGVLINGLYIQIQLKVDGPHKRDGTFKPENGRGGRSNYKHCSFYDNMFIIFIRVRIVNGVQVLCLWFTEDATNVPRYMTEHMDGFLGHQRLPQRSMEDLIQAIWKSTLTKVTLREMLMHVVDINQFKEVCKIEALRMVYDVQVPEGNQQEFDCYLNGQRVQVKGHNLKSGQAGMHHCVNGIDCQPYSSDDPIDAFVVSCIIACQQRFFLLYVWFSKDTLIKNKILKHKKCGNYESSNGSTQLRVSCGMYEKLLTGRIKKSRSQTKWLEGHSFKHVELVPHTEENPQPHQLTIEHLNKVAQKVADESAMPSNMLQT